MSCAHTVIEDDPAYTAEGALPELIEAAVRAGDYEAAATARKTLSERALAAGTPWALGLRARCEALLAEGPDAEGYYLESIRQLSQCRMAVDLAAHSPALRPVAPPGQTAAGRTARAAHRT